MIYYRPQTKFWKGNVFRSVCKELGPQGGVCQTPGRHNPGKTPHPTPSRRLLQRTVRILLECIHVRIKHLTSLNFWKPVAKHSAVADPGFPRGGDANLQGGRQHTIWSKFPQNCMKLKEFRLRGGHASGIFLFRSAIGDGSRISQTGEAQISKGNADLLFGQLLPKTA